MKIEAFCTGKPSRSRRTCSFGTTQLRIFVAFKNQPLTYFADENEAQFATMKANFIPDISLWMQPVVVCIFRA